MLCAPCLGYVIRVGHGSPQTTASSSTPESISSLGGGFSHKSADASAECSHCLLWGTWFPVLSNESLFYISFYLLCFLRSSVSKESACNAGDLGSVPGSGRSPGGGHGNPLQYSCLENPSLFIYLWLRLIFVAAGRLSLVWKMVTILSVQGVGFSLQWLLLLWSAGSRALGLQSLWHVASEVSAPGL